MHLYGLDLGKKKGKFFALRWSGRPLKERYPRERQKTEACAWTTGGKGDYIKQGTGRRKKDAP